MSAAIQTCLLQLQRYVNHYAISSVIRAIPPSHPYSCSLDVHVLFVGGLKSHCYAIILANLVL